MARQEVLVAVQGIAGLEVPERQTRDTLAAMAAHHQAISRVVAVAALEP